MRQASAGLASRQAAVKQLEKIWADGHMLEQDRAEDRSNGGLSDPRDRDFTRLLTLTCLRHLGEIDACLAQLMERPLPAKHRRVTQILRIGAAQILFLDTPVHAAVNTAVTMTASGKHAALKGMVNAVLRRLAAERESLRRPLDVDIVNAPQWLWQSWVEHYGEDMARRMAAVHRQLPPLDITLKDSSPHALTEWATRLKGQALSTGSVRLAAPAAVTALPGYAEGAWWVQDTAASMPVKLLGALRGKTVLDLAAAPGGKTAQMAAAGAQVIALDRAGARLARLRDNMRRLGMTAQVEIVEADMLDWQPANAPDMIVLDAPCSATGTIRRHPELPYIRNPEDVTECAALQQRMLERALSWLPVGGTLVYCVCSLQPEEGEMQIVQLMRQGGGAGWRLADAANYLGTAPWVTNSYLRTLSCHLADEGGMDGFFAARLEKHA